MGALKHIVRAVCLLLLCTFVCGTAAASFPDVSPEEWYGAAVARMEKEGLIIGFEDGTFRPESRITASQFVTVVARMASLTPVTPTWSDHWAAGTMEAAMQSGWYDWDELPPSGERFEDPIPRQLAVKILMKALFPDVRGDYNTESAKMRDFSALNGRYYEPVLAAYALGIIQGDDKGNFNPVDTMTRAEASIVFTRALDSTGVVPSPPPSEQPQYPTDPQQPSEQETDPVPDPVVTVKGGVSENGWLQVVGTQLCNEAGDPVVLHGMSSHGLQWYGNYTNAQSIRNTASFGANVFRVAMYTAEGGYLSDKSGIKKKLYAAVDAAIENDLYVIIDWHILSDGNPQTNKKAAKAFFAEVSERYKDSPAVIYEVCNEPNGGITWKKDIKPYEEEVVAVIREHSPKAVILLGSGTWSQDIHDAAKDPVKGENLMYTLHFYAGTHGESLRKRIDEARKAGLAVFVSEWGTSRADGGGGVFLDASRVWLDFLDERGISWCNWSLCDKNETSAALKSGTPNNRAWTEKDLSESGKFVFSRF